MDALLALHYGFSSMVIISLPWLARLSECGFGKYPEGLPEVFDTTHLADRFGVRACDLLGLEANNIVTCDEFYYNLSSEQACSLSNTCKMIIVSSSIASRRRSVRGVWRHTFSMPPVPRLAGLAGCPIECNIACVNGGFLHVSLSCNLANCTQIMN